MNMMMLHRVKLLLQGQARPNYRLISQNSANLGISRLPPSSALRKIHFDKLKSRPLLSGLIGKSSLQHQSLKSLNFNANARFNSNDKENESKNNEDHIKKENDGQIIQEPIQTIDEVQKLSPKNMSFKAETQRLLHIVTHSLYKDKDVFLRELLSNASDALEKQRIAEVSGIGKGSQELRISITIDEKKKAIMIQDSGCGMTQETLIKDLGTIAHSGSQQFLQKLEESTEKNIIGQFGVGFYSVFMVADSVDVISRVSASEPAYCWSSDGSDDYQISEVASANFDRGTQITIRLKPECGHFAKIQEVEKIIQRYSNFISFPIVINGKKFNLQQAIWYREKSEVTNKEYQEFFEFITNQKLRYKWKLHYKIDAPLAIRALIYVPQSHSEKFGFGMEETSVNLYSRRVLLKQKVKEIIPNYLRFLKGVIDCEDIPLNISREMYQDSALISKVKSVMTKRILKMLVEESEKNEEDYLQWYQDFQLFLKEGLAMDSENKELLLSLVRYQVNYKDGWIKLGDYKKKQRDNLKKVFYILAQSREAALNSPYIEPFNGTDIPVIVVTVNLDEMVFRQVQDSEEYKFVNIESDPLDLKEISKSTEPLSVESVPQDELPPLCLWIKNELAPVVNKVQPSERLKSSPAIIVSQLSSGMRQMMAMIEKTQNVSTMDQNKDLTLEINPNHEFIIKLNQLRKTNSDIAQTIIRQILDNCLLSSGLVVDYPQLIGRMGKLMNLVLDQALEQKVTTALVARFFIIQPAREEMPKLMSETTSKDRGDEDIILDADGNPKLK